MGVTVRVRLLGIFRKARGEERISVKMDSPTPVIQIIHKIAESSPGLRRALIDPELGDPRPNTLILVNGREISALEGLETIVEDGDEVVLIPVTHGG
jgi:molybdopterin synthase sulfur carrier subunit